MELTIGWHDFNGPYEHAAALPHENGVVAVVCPVEVGKILIIDVFEAEDAAETVHSHAHHDCWAHHCDKPVQFFLLSTIGQDRAKRQALVRDIRQQYENIACG